MLFHIIDDAFVILRSRGVYRQAKLYRRAGHLYAGHAGGFIKLFPQHGTSASSVSWLDLVGVTVPDERSTPFGLIYDHPSSKVITDQTS